MKRRRHTPEQIVRKLREVERLLGEGQTIAESAKQVEISEQTYHRWRNQYGGMKADDAKRLRELERENARLKRIVADKELEIDALKEIARGTGKPVAPARGGPHVAGPLGSRRREAVRMLQDPSDCRNGGHAGSPASTAPRSAASRRAAAATTRSGRSCTPSRVATPAGATAGPGRPCARRAGA